MNLSTTKPAKARKPVMRKCAVCRELFEKRSMTHKACSPDCAAKVAQIKREKEESRAAKIERQNIAKKLKDLRPKKWWLAKARTALHAYIRARDEGKSCISCSTLLIKLGGPGGDYDAGHFLSVGSAKHLQFEEKNIFGQCKKCNDYLKGNQIEYERGLIKLKGQQYVDDLKADQAVRHLHIEDYQDIEAEYKAKLKILQQQKQQ